MPGTVRPVSSSIVVSTDAYLNASESRITFVRLTGSSTARWPVSTRLARSSAVMLAGLKKRGWSGKTSPADPENASTRASSSGRSCARPPASHSRAHASRIHSPITFRRKRTVPKAPVSFVKLARATASLMRTDSRSTPTSDHVPDEM